MGLDQYGFIRQKNGQQKEFYWRKHSRLQEFMQKLWHEKGNSNEFNCEEMPLTEENLQLLKQQIESNFDGNFCAGGFFWGHQFQEDAVKQYQEEDTQFVNEALDAVRKGDEVIYSCWW